MKLAKFFAGCLMVLAGSAVAAAQPVPATSESAHSDLRVRLLGTGSPLPQTFRFGPSTLIEAGNQKFLFDAGRGVIQRLYSFGIPFNDVDKLFLTHLHSDHTIGIPDLYLTGWLRGRNHPLHVWGPVGTRNLMDELAKAYSFDIKIRLDHNPGSKVETTEFTAGVIYDHDGVKITAFPVDHGEAKPAFGFRIDYKGHRVVLSGDTRYSQEVIKQAKGADLLVHEVAAASDKLMKTSPKIPRILGIHTSPEDAGRVFTQAAPRMAVYSHIVLFGVTEKELEARTRKTYSGPLTIGEDLMTFDIGDKITVSRTQPKE
ncbi:MAG TPA: MBL fold metallo-hydrolase [Eoetvoesiella sp.]|uniref:MBL fold metallo-hydrolase n=1 Tax=Eoetvoesiella sp. TaxID=1966355 RepID=UPI002CF18869|nr:MBL fold metallo-hydrolase [Eoetvoesiella sp.]HWK62401.1 MBL fold metallo-hydrolase [Eoetvoesiella sp.]